MRSMDKIAPLSLAEVAWDNVGLLVEAPTPRVGATRVFLTIDLTREVLEEALKDPSTGVILAYHPVLFKPLKRLTLGPDNEKASIALRAASAGVSIYSPHTALDSCSGGINDWLARGLGPGQTFPITPASNPPLGQEGSGSGRLHSLDEPVELNELVNRVKSFLQLPFGMRSLSPVYLK